MPHMAKEGPIQYGRVGLAHNLEEKMVDSLIGVEVVSLPLKIGDIMYEYAVSFGSITRAKADAILCPTAGSFDKVVAGGISGAILSESGLDKTDYSSELQEMAGQLIPNYDSTRGTAPTGFSLALPSGRLVEKGIKHIIFTNVTPSGEEQLDADLVAKCVASALAEAGRVGSKSLAVPAFETGFAGLSLRSSIEGTVKSLVKYDEIARAESGEARVIKLTQVLFFKPSYSNAIAVAELLEGLISDWGRS